MAETTRIGKYEIRREIGRGAMGVVYEGFDPQLERLVAIRTVRADWPAGEEWSTMNARFRREAQAAGRLYHPNIVSIYEFGEENGVWYIVMEFIKGRELKDYLDRDERFSLPDTVRIMSQVLDALGASHRQGVVHHDIKPANIFLLPDGTVKVADFGIAHIETSSMTQVGTMLGTPAYMSPEQIMGLHVDGRTDLFSAGAIFYQLLTGERPFAGSATTTMQKVLKEDPLPPSTINVQAPAGMDTIVRKALAKRPEERFQTAQEFADALRAGDENDSTLVRPMSQAQVDPLVDKQPRARASGASPSELQTRIKESFSLKEPWWMRMTETYRGYLKRLTAGASILKRTPREAEPVLLGVSAPKRCAPGRQFTAVVVAYIETTRAFAQRTLHGFAEEGDRIITDVPPDRNARWMVGTPVTVRVTGEFFDITPAEIRFEWNGCANVAAFSVHVKDTAPKTSVSLCFHVLIANVPLAFIPLQIEIDTGTVESGPNQVTSRSPNSAFASYASKDAELVAYSLSTLSRWVPALDIFQDCLDLTPNEKFKPQLSEQIAARDVFLLYWSRHAAASPWVRWEYDIARAKKGMGAILPMPLEDPAIAPPPDEYLEVHMRDRFLVAGYGLARIKELAANARQPPPS